MHKYFFLASLLILTLFACKQEDDDMGGGGNPMPSSAPNILLIIADDMGIDATPGYSIGAQKPNMPHLDDLASKGITFDNAWAYPVCSPTRAAILTGRYGYRTGVLTVAGNNAGIDPTETTLQAFLDEQSSTTYQHALIGKWHLSGNDLDRPTQMGIGHYAGIIGGGVGNYSMWPLTENGATNTFSGYVTTKLTDLALDWINQQDDPWFCWLAYNAPHSPFHLPPADMHSQGALPEDEASIDANPTPYYLAMAESIDHEIGRIMDAIPPEDLDNTIIIFVGDNGTPGQVVQAPYQSMRSKGSLFQGGVHVPLIVAGKGVTRSNLRESSLVHVADLFATIAEIAGISLDTYEDSFSFYPLLSESGTGARTINYSEADNEDNPSRAGYAIRNQQYKLITYDTGDRRFHDLSADPYEQDNLLDGTLSTEQSMNLQELEEAASEIRQ